MTAAPVRVLMAATELEGMKSLNTVKAPLLATASVDDGSAASCHIGSTWNQPPLSPAGSRPSRANSPATYADVANAPTLPVSRPIVESSAMRNRRSRRSAALISAEVPPARGATFVAAAAGLAGPLQASDHPATLPSTSLQTALEKRVEREMVGASERCMAGSGNE